MKTATIQINPEVMAYYDLEKTLHIKLFSGKKLNELSKAQLGCLQILDAIEKSIE